MQTPQKVGSQGSGALDALLARVSALEKALDAVSRKTLYSMTIGDANDVHIDIGPNGSPEIDMYPDNTGVRSQMKTFPSSDPNGNISPEFIIDLQNSSGTQDGGTLHLWQQGAAFGVEEASGTEGFLYFDDNMNLQFMGGFSPIQAWNGLAAIYFTGFNSGSGSFNSGPLSYGPTYATAPFVFVTDSITGGTGNAQAYCTAESTTSFSLQFTGTGNHNPRIWAVRFN